MGVTTETVNVNVPMKTFHLTEEKEEGGASLLRIERVKANGGDKIRWDAGDHTISIWFPSSGVFVSPVLAVMHKGIVEALIPEGASPGVYEYSIYCHDTGSFVVCESHPKLEIPDPGP